MTTLDELFEKQNPQDGTCPPWAKKLAIKYATLHVEQALRGVSDMIFEDHMTTISREDITNSYDLTKIK